MERAQANAMEIAHWLQKQSCVTEVIYPGLKSHPGHEIMKKQARGFGAMLTFQVKNQAYAYAILGKVRMIKYAESLGGVESLLTYPMKQTHADVPVEVREALGVNEKLLRMSVGIENIDDLLADLEQAFA